MLQSAWVNTLVVERAIEWKIRLISQASDETYEGNDINIFGTGGWYRKCSNEAALVLPARSHCVPRNDPFSRKAHEDTDEALLTKLAAGCAEQRPQGF